MGQGIDREMGQYKHSSYPVSHNKVNACMYINSQAETERRGEDRRLGKRREKNEIERTFPRLQQITVASPGLTSPRILKRDDLPHPLGPHTTTFMPDHTSEFSSCTTPSPSGVTSGMCSNQITLSSLTTDPVPGCSVRVRVSVGKCQRLGSVLISVAFHHSYLKDV